MSPSLAAGWKAMTRQRKQRRWMVLIAIGVLIGLGVVKNVVAKMAVVGGVKAVTGLRVQVGHMDLGWLKTRVALQRVRVLNPPEYSDPVMVSLPELYVDYDAGAFLRGRAHLEMVRVHVEELMVVKNANGQVNVNQLKVVLGGAPAKQPELLVDQLELKVGRVIYKDYSRGAAPTVQVFDVNIHERYERITSPQALASVILVKALAKTTVAHLAKIDLGGLRAKAEEGIKGAATKLIDSTIGVEGVETLRSLFTGSDPDAP